MKKIILVTIISLVSFSCQKDHIDKPITMIDSTQIEPPLPILNISYSILDSGYVQFFNNTKRTNVGGDIWGISYFRSYTKAPLFRFTKNGIYTCYYTASNHIGSSVVFKDTTFKIEIKNAIRLDKDRIISGVVFGDSVRFVSDNNDQLQNFLRSTWPFGFAPYPPTVVISSKAISLYIAIADDTRAMGLDVISMRKLYTKGIKELQTYKGMGQWTPGWQVWIGNPNSASSPHYDSGSENNKDNFLEILDVKEVYQPYLFPTLQNIAFIVKYHIKATTENNQKIDLIVEVKHMAYDKDDWE